MKTLFVTLFICVLSLPSIAGLKTDTTFNNLQIDSANALLKIAKNLVQKDSLREALPILNKSISMNPANPYAYYLRGHLFYYQGKYESAIQDLNIEINADPDYAETVFLRGACYHHLKKYERAIYDFTICLNVDPFYAEALFLRGLDKSHIKDRDGAIQDYIRILADDKTLVNLNWTGPATVLNNLGYSLMEIGDMEQALPLLQKALKLDREKAYIWGSLGEYYFKVGKFYECISHMDKAIKLLESDPWQSQSSEDCASSYYYRGMAKVKRGNNYEGCIDLQKAAELGYKDAPSELKTICK